MSHVFDHLNLIFGQFPLATAKTWCGGLVLFGSRSGTAARSHVRNWFLLNIWLLQLENASSICGIYLFTHIGHNNGRVPQCQNASAGKWIFDKITSFVPQPNMHLPPQQVLAVARGNCPKIRFKWSNMLICLGCNKDLWSWRPKYKSYRALRGCDLGVRDCLQVYCGKERQWDRGSAMWCEIVQNKCKTVWGVSAKSQFWGRLLI